MRQESELGRVEFMRRPPHRLLGRFVHGYTGFDERVEGTMRRRELPSGRIPLILNLGPTLEVNFPAERSPSRFASFAAGMHTARALTAYEDASRGVQVDLTPLGARMLFGLPMAELANRVVGLDFREFAATTPTEYMAARLPRRDRDQRLTRPRA